MIKGIGYRLGLGLGLTLGSGLVWGRVDLETGNPGAAVMTSEHKQTDINTHSNIQNHKLPIHI